MLLFRQPRGAVLKASPSKLERVIDRLAPKMSRAFADAALKAQGRIDLDVLAANVEAGRVGRIIRLLDLQTFVEDDLVPTMSYLVDAYEAGQKLGVISKRLPAVSLDLKTTNPKALLAAERQAAGLLTAVNEETKQTVRDLIVRAYREQVSPRDIARLIRDIIGLNDRQTTALFNYRSGLIEDGRDPDQVERMTERYGNRLLRQRADTIAQHEIHGASVRGQKDLWKEGVTEGRIDAGVARRIWIANVGACEWCEAIESLNENGVPIDGQYETPDGDRIDGPEDSHVGCRCAEGLKTE